MKDKNKVAVSPSRPLIGSTAVEDAERYDAEYNDDYEEKPLGYDDPNCCEHCGDDVDKGGFCWSCDF